MSKLTTKEKEFAKKYSILQKTLIKIKSYFSEKYKDEWLDYFKNNPYNAMEIDGFGFKRCDTIAMKIGFDEKHPFRIKAYVSYAVEKNSKGDTIVLLSKIIDSIARDLLILDKMLILTVILETGDDYVLLDGAHKSLTRKMIDNGNLPIYITLYDWYQSEKFMYEWGKELSKTERVNKNQDIIDTVINNSTLNAQQKDAVSRILDENFNLLIGSSGAGKTYTTNRIIEVLEKHNLTYCLLTPTGIASFNLSEKTKRESKTIHRKFYQEELITTDYLIIDEFGMCGCNHINMLKSILPHKNKTRVIFIGDKYQLPSISAGDFLASVMNLINSGVINGNVFELTEIMRASSSSFIPHLCNMFTGNRYFDASVMTKSDLKGVKFYDRELDLFHQISKIIKDNNWSFYDTCVIMAQRKGEYGCDAFNLYMQKLNKSEIFYKDKFKEFKKNDILMHIKNNMRLNIYNGELIEILEKDDDDCYRARRLYDSTIIEYDDDTLKEQVSLSYANSVHKVQGSTIKNVIFVAIQEHSYMLSRNLVYVGMSRASDNLVVICDKDTLVKSSYKNLTDKRKTFLNLLCK